ncbi:lipid-A-disaccharide synthase [Pseudomonadota bacterium]
MKIGIVAGEASGDLLATGLIDAIKACCPDAEFEGIAGPAMINAGCKALYPSEKLAVMGIEALLHYRELKGIQNKLVQHFIDNPPDVFIGVDAPDFTLTIERKLKEKGIKAVHYVSPSVWAWRQYRVKKIARSVDMMMTLFPFEADFYREHDVPVKFVGHPLADMIPIEIDTNAMRQTLGIEANGPVVAILPGSRMSEVSRLSGVMLEAAQLIANKFPAVEFVAPMASAKVRECFEQNLKESGANIQLKTIDGQARDVMAAADIVLLASGTAALEGMLLKRPMVVAYRFSWLGTLIVKRLVKTKYVSLPNILLGKEMAPEFIHENATAENLAQGVIRQLEDSELTGRIREQYASVHHQLKQDASRSAAEAVLQLLNE